MSPIIGGAFAPRLVRRPVKLIALSIMLLFAQSAHAQPDPLTFFKNYFVTGDYVVRGVSLWRKGVNGKATVDIPKLGGTDGVPVASDIVAAFLYVQTAERIQGSGIHNAKFAGNALGPFTAPGSTEPGSGTVALALNWDLATPPCWSIALPGTRRLVTYRADVLRFLPIDPATGKQALNRTLRVVVPDSGIEYGDDDEGGRERTDKTGPRAIGVSLVVVYRDPSKPFKAIVMYDGGFTKRAFQTMNQTIRGFYDASTGTPVAKAASMTHIVGDGRGFLFERVKLDGQVIATNPFRSLFGAKWDNWRTNISLPSHAESMALSVEPLGLPDCLSWSAIIVGTNVQDTDNDGLLDKWETQTGLTDPTGQLLPDLSGMGADPLVKDLFVEVAYMHAAAGTLYGGVSKRAHSHLPSLEALNLVGKAFEDAPTIFSDGSAGPGRINVHFDVGNNYQTNPPNPYILPVAFAEGGKNISETMACVDPIDAEKIIECAGRPIPGQFPLYPGTVGWKTGFRFLRDEILGFDSNRKDMFRFALFAHSVGMPKEPCLNEVTGLPDLTCQATNPDFHVPRTASGIGDFPGGDLLVTLGAFPDSNLLPQGSPFMQAGTLMHELGHTYEFTHAGIQKYGVPREPNCKSNYLSSMNYLFQLRGVLNFEGKAEVAFNGNVYANIFEQGISDGLPLGDLAYRTGWYAPFKNSYLDGVTKDHAKPATKHCDGSDLSAAELEDITNGGGMVRVDAISLDGTKIDWNANPALDSSPSQDINFDGKTTQLKAAPNDWANIRLNQLGGRRNVGALYIDAQGRRNMGPFSLDVGRGDIGRGDIGRGDIGRGDIGRGDIGRGDIGRGDIGRGDIGRGDIGRGDIGRGAFGGGDLDVGAADEPVGELDLETFTAAAGGAPTPANGLTACLTTGGDVDPYTCTTDGGNIPVRLDWQKPHIGKVVAYRIYRFEVDLESPFPPASLPDDPIATIYGEGTPPTTYLDDFDDLYGAPSDTPFAYFVVAEFSDESVSGISNFARITTPSSDYNPLLARRGAVFNFDIAGAASLTYDRVALARGSFTLGNDAGSSDASKGWRHLPITVRRPWIASPDPGRGKAMDE